MTGFTVADAARAETPALPAAQVGSPAEWRPLAPKDEFTGEPGYYAMQAARDGKLVLTASNGFFSRGLSAKDGYPVPDAETRSFIKKDFGYITGWSKSGLTARWHVLVTRPGELRVTPGPFVPGKGRFRIVIGGREQPFLYENGKPAEAIFNIENPGALVLTVSAEGDADPQSRLGDLALRGSAMTDAGLLRARWRPAATHNRYAASGAQAADLWVMTMRSASPVPSYSPITTPFGYFGTVFQADGASSGSCNFSLWSNAKDPQSRWSHLLATGSLEADFGSFGHEGIGVKLRGDWKPLAGAKTITLALRRESNPPFDTYYGYYFDPSRDRWRLYGVGRKIAKNGRPPALFPGDFVEQPGPPEVERSGDLVRNIQRAGWVATRDGPWVRLDSIRGSGAGKYANIHRGITADGWFEMGMGGMAHFLHKTAPVVSLPKALVEKADAPAFLSAAHRAELFSLPVRWGARTFTDITADSAKLKLHLEHAGTHARATVYYGPEDCLTFNRDLGYKEAGTRTWASHLPPVPVSSGDTVFPLTSLQPKTRYFVRILIENDEGKVWTFETDRFETQPSPSASGAER